jgi:hypothetical protein
MSEAKKTRIAAALERQRALIRATEERHMRALAKKLGFAVIRKKPG